MREMKDSGIPWIGEIPRNWNITKLGRLYCIRNTKVSDDKYSPLSVTKLGILPQLVFVAKSDDHDNRKLVKKGDFVINSRSDRRGACGISSLEGSVSLINIVLTPLGKMNPDYYNLLFHSIQFADEFYKWGHGIVDDLWTTRWQDMKKINVPVPSLFEQQRIANYLDTRCSQIDFIRKNVEAEIEALKQYKQSVITEAVTKGLDKDVEMKNSGIPWIGNVNCFFTATRFKYVATINSNLVNPVLYKECNQLAPDCIEKNSGKIVMHRTVDEASVDSWNHLFKKGQILYSKIRPVLNKVCIAPYDGLCSADMYPIDTNCDTSFFLYLMLSNYFVSQVDVITRDRIKMPKINQNELGNIIIYLPDKHTQREIAKYLDAKCAKIDSIIQKKQELLTKLDTYKKSLIYEYVTGKKEVPAV